MSELSDSEIIRRYRETYKVGETVGLEQAREHLQLERRLTAELLASTPANRWETFTRCYTELYENLPWLNQSAEEQADASGWLAQWSQLLPKHASIFEVGSGKAELLKYLCRQGYQCVATEITKERGSKHLAQSDGLEWHLTDGVNLAQFEPAEKYDVIISTDVVEHFHPDDLLVHFSNAMQLLKPGGKYIFTTPHRATGPHDLSMVFGYDKAVCMHLKEYDNIELHRALEQVGFKSIQAVFPPTRLFQKIKFTAESTAYLNYLRFWDLLDSKLKLNAGTRRNVRRLLKAFCVPEKIWISAQKNS